MSTSPPAAVSLVRPSPPRSLAWRSWTLRDDGPSAWLLVVAGVVLALLARAVTGSDVLGFVTLAAMWLSCWRLFIPARYEMGPDGILCRVAGRERRIGWPTIGQYEFHARGVLFFPRATGRFATLRGFYVPWSDRGYEVQAIVRYYLGRPHGEAPTAIEQAGDEVRNAS